MILGGNKLHDIFSMGVWKCYRDDKILTIPDMQHMIGPNSIDVTLSRNFLIPKSEGVVFLNGASPEYREEQTAIKPVGPGDFFLGCTQERFECDNSINGKLFAPMYDGRSTMGRLGIGTHVTAGFGDHGFQGSFTLEIFNVSKMTIVLEEGMRIGQIFFMEVDSPMHYEGKINSAYQGKDHYNKPVIPALGEGRF